MVDRLPVLFISHGAPNILLLNDPVLDQWRAEVKKIPRPDKILIISAHWDTPSIQLGGNRKQRTIHDFSGFPPELYQYEYSSISDVAWADELATQLSVEVEHERGLDHGAWVPLLTMFPEADIPVVQISVSSSMSCAEHFAFGRQLEKLRSEGVLIIASGVIVHNLAELSWADVAAAPAPWAESFMTAFNLSIETGDWQTLLQPEQLRYGVRAVPTIEHYLPFIIAAGASGKDNARVFCDEWRYANLSMHSYHFG